MKHVWFIGLKWFMDFWPQTWNSKFNTTQANKEQMSVCMFVCLFVCLFFCLSVLHPYHSFCMWPSKTHWFLQGRRPKFWIYTMFSILCSFIVWKLTDLSIWSSKEHVWSSKDHIYMIIQWPYLIIQWPYLNIQGAYLSDHPGSISDHPRTMSETYFYKVFDLVRKTVWCIRPRSKQCMMYSTSICVSTAATHFTHLAITPDDSISAGSYGICCFVTSARLSTRCESAMQDACIRRRRKYHGAREISCSRPKRCTHPACGHNRSRVPAICKITMKQTTSWQTWNTDAKNCMNMSVGTLRNRVGAQHIATRYDRDLEQCQHTVRDISVWASYYGS